MRLFRRSKKEEPERDSILDFNPIDSIAFQSDKPIYTNINYEVRYSPHGRLETNSPIIWRDEKKFERSIRTCYVSPNADYIVIYQQNCLFVLTKEGKLLDTIRNVDSASNGKFDASSVQWAKDSSCFYLLFYDVYTSDLYKQHKNKSTLYRFSIQERKLERFISFQTEVFCFHYYLSNDKRNIYFKPWHSHHFYRLTIEEGNTAKIKIQEIIVNENGSYVYKMLANGQAIATVEKIENEFGRLFINFSDGSFQKSGVQLESYDLNTILSCDFQGLYLIKNYQVSKVFSIKGNEENWSAKRSSGSLHDAYFLPGNRFCLFKLYAKEYQGYLVLDTASNQYAKLPYTRLDCYFSITTEDCSQLRYDIMVEPKWDTSEFRGYRFDTNNGQCTIVEPPLPQPNLRDALKAYKNDNLQKETKG